MAHIKKQMDYSEKYFGKKLDKITFSDIEVYFTDEKDESNKIEFKSYSEEYGNFNKNLKSIIRAICGFLNSEGGLIIWGAPEGRKAKDHNGKVFSGKLSPVKVLKDKDWIINKISDLITPLPTDIEVQIISQEDNHIYIFEIKKKQIQSTSVY